MTGKDMEGSSVRAFEGAMQHLPEATEKKITSRKMEVL
jgi:hypothetical protein